MLACGSTGDGCSNEQDILAECRDNSEVHEVSCCSDGSPGDDIVSAHPGWANVRQNTCPDVWGMRRPTGNNDSCNHAATYQEAVDWCADYGGRLCTAAEIDSDCTRGTGCSHDADLLWTSDSDAGLCQSLASAAGPVTFINSTAVTLAQGEPVATADIPVDFEIGFDVTPSDELEGSWGSIIHISATGGNCCGYGDRVPAVWFKPNDRRLHIRDGHGANGNEGCDPDDQLPAGETTSVTLQMTASGFTVLYNGTVKCEGNRGDRQFFPLATVWAPDPWHAPARATLANFYLLPLPMSAGGREVGREACEANPSVWSPEPYARLAQENCRAWLPGLYFEAYDFLGQNLASTEDGVHTAVWNGMTPIVAHPALGNAVWYSNDNAFVADIPDFDLYNGYYMRWRGQFEVTAAGEYRFKTRSDDGSRLYIDEQLVVDNDGWHGMRVREGAVTFTEDEIGWKDITITFYEDGGGSGLEVSVRPPGDPGCKDTSFSTSSACETQGVWDVDASTCNVAEGGREMNQIACEAAASEWEWWQLSSDMTRATVSSP